MVLTGADLVETARRLAVQCHEGQLRADRRTPYICHPLTVEEIFIREYGTTIGAVELCRGRALCLAHDIAEHDAARRMSVTELSDAGLESVAEELELLTHDEGTYLDYILRLRGSGNSLAIRAKLSDMAANLGDLVNIPSPGARKGLQTKYDLARWILTH